MGLFNQTVPHVFLGDLYPPVIKGALGVTAGAAVAGALALGVKALTAQGYASGAVDEKTAQILMTGADLVSDPVGTTKKVINDYVSQVAGANNQS